MDTTQLKCPGCGASLPYNAERRLWKCERCGSEYDRQQIIQITQQKSDSDIDINRPDYQQDSPASDYGGPQPVLNIYKCNSCGGEMVADENTASTFCPYCGNTNILKSRLEGEFRPKYVIPFCQTKDDAVAGYVALRKGRFLAPSEFGSASNIEKLAGVYIPFWLYKGRSFGHVSGDRHVKTTWRSGDYIVTKTDVYFELREGSEAFDKVPADGSRKFDDDLMDSVEPFNFSKLEPFNYSYLSGFLAEKFDVSPDENRPRAILRMNNSLRQDIYSTISGSLVSARENFHCNIHDIEYALLPVWMMNVFVDGKPHTFAMNGQTGQTVGNVPVDTFKMIMFLLGCLISCVGLALGISYLYNDCRFDSDESLWMPIPMGLIVGLVFFFAHYSKYKMVKRGTTAHSYKVPGSFVLTQNVTRYVRSFTRRIYSPRNKK